MLLIEFGGCFAGNPISDSWHGTNNRFLKKGKLKVGICGEHGGEPRSVKFRYHTGTNYGSCSPFRAPIAWVASAKAAIKAGKDQL